MKRVLVGGLVILLGVGVPAWAATITVGDHLLAPDTPNQEVSILVSGGENIAGMELFASIGGGGSAHGGTDGPSFEDEPDWDPEMKLGTIWDDTGWPDGLAFADLLPDPFGSQFVVGSIFILSNSIEEVPAEGILVKLQVDTTGWFAGDGPWDLRFSDAQPLAADETLLADRLGARIDLTVLDGSISIIPEPTAGVILLGLLTGLPFGLVWRRRTE